MSLSITSPAFSANARIPDRFTGDGTDVSPALKWTGVPAEAKSLALVCDDPDAPRADPWTHWLIYDLPAAPAGGLPEGVARENTLAEPKGAKQGTNDFGKIGWNGPAPPRGHGTHHYHFKLYALSKPVGLAPGAKKRDLLAAIKGTVVGEGEIMGTYERR